MGTAVAFWTMAVIAVSAALAVVLLRNVFRAALSLVACFLMVAGLYVTLSADFLAAVQILVYVGAISVLIILAVMMTREVQQGSPSNQMQLPALLVAVLLLTVIVYAVVRTPWQLSAAVPLAPTTGPLALQLFGGGSGYILTVEIAGLLMLAAIIGAVVLAREK